MKLKRLTAYLMALALVGGLGTRVLLAEDDDDDAQDQARLAGQAKVSKEVAEKSALAKVPNSTVKESEIENEDSKLVWSFDLATTGSKDITEVTVDATTGAVISAKVDKDDDDDNGKDDDDDEKGGDDKD